MPAAVLLSLSFCLAFFWLAEKLSLTIDEGTGSVVGGVAAGVFGLFGVTISALFGLQLIRRDRRDDIQTQTKSLAAALSAEMADLSEVLNARKREIEKSNDDLVRDQDLFHLSTKVYEANLDRLGLLGPELSQAVVSTYGRVLVWKHSSKVRQGTSEREGASERQGQIANMMDQVAIELRVLAGVDFEDQAMPI